MNTLTACLVVMTLIGTPVSSAVCAMVCGHGTAPAAHCHEHMTDTAAVAIAADIACSALLPDVPYVRESVTLPQAGVDATATLLFDRGAARLAAHFSPASAADSWVRPPLILRL